MVQIKEPEKKTVLGVLNLPLSRLLGVSNMAIDQRFPLERSGANSQIKLKATLRVGKHNTPRQWEYTVSDTKRTVSCVLFICS